MGILVNYFIIRGKMKDFIPDLTTMIRRVFKDKAINDQFAIMERIRGDKESGLISETKVFVKSYIGWKKILTDKKTISKLKDEIKVIVGDHILIDIQSGEGDKLVWGSGQENLESEISRKFNYQFQITVLKKLGGSSNAKKKQL